MTQTPVAPLLPEAGGDLPATPRPTPGQVAAAPVSTAVDLVRPPRETTPAGSNVWATVRAYVALTKPRIIELLLVTTVPTMVLAADGWPGWVVLVATLVGGTLAAGSANAFNCYIDRDIDALMRRTGHRPLVNGGPGGAVVSPRAALVFGWVLGVVAVTTMAVLTTWLAAVLTAAAIAFYAIVYTMLLKRRTSQNIVWGGAAGCMPVLIGWAAVTGSLSWASVALFAVIFFWTPPHFWSLAMRYREDYARAGVPMLPVVAGPVTVARQIVGYTWLTVAASVAVWPLSSSVSWLYGVLAGAAGLLLVVAAHRVLAGVKRDTAPDGSLSGASVAAPMRLFHLSNTYLAFVFVALAVDVLVR
ncbi:heme o synthase [Jatrophihabitans sp. YIM 134969]